MKVKYYDPYFKQFPHQRNFNFKINFQELNVKNIKNADCVIILTDHDKINYNLIKENARLIFDTRYRIKKNKNLINL